MVTNYDKMYEDRCFVNGIYEEREREREWGKGKWVVGCVMIEGLSGWE